MLGFLANIGLATGRSQLIAISVAIAALVIFFLVKMWQSDIEEKTRADIKGELQAATIDAQRKANKADEKVFNADDSLLCAILGGCKLPGEADNGGNN